MIETIILPPNTTVVGQCSICGGLVTVPTMWFSTLPPPMTCIACGATGKPPQTDLPVIPMQEVNVKTTLVSTNGTDDMPSFTC